MAEKVIEKRSCYSEETLKEAVRLVTVEGFSFSKKNKKPRKNRTKKGETKIADANKRQEKKGSN